MFEHTSKEGRHGKATERQDRSRTMAHLCSLGAAVVSRRDPRFAAVLVVAQEAFPLDNRVWQHIDSGHQSVDFDAMLSNGTFTSTERLLLEIAASLWSSGDHPTLLGVVADRLGDEWLAVILRALAAARGAHLLASGHALDGR